MEDIYSLKNVPWISEPINLKTFMEEYQSMLSNVSGIDSEKTDVVDAVADFLNLPADNSKIGKADIQKLMEECSPDLLTVEDELTPQDASKDCSRYSGRKQNVFAGTFQDGVIPGEAEENLNTLRLQAEELNLRETVHDYGRLRMRSLKYSGTVRMITDEDNSPAPSIKTSKDKIKNHKNIVINVRIHRPYHKKTHLKKACNRFTSHSQEFLVLGSKKLTELRDAIACINDRGVHKDFSDNPDLSLVAKLPNNMTEYPSGFFYINGVFYDDCRSENSKSYSENIINWAKKHPDIGHLEVKNMDTTTFFDLELRLGYPYVYFHQGSCEHIIVFTDVRLLHKHDVQDPSRYPILRGQASKISVKCLICSLRLANWVVLNEDRLPVPNAHLCHTCLKAFCYDSKGVKIKNIKVFPFFDEFNPQQKLKQNGK